MLPRIFALMLFVALAVSLPPVVSAQSPLPSSGIVNIKANLRSGPSTADTIVGRAQLGQVVTIVEVASDGQWYKLDTGVWIHASLVNMGGAASPSVANSANSTPAPTANAAQTTSKPPSSANVVVKAQANLRGGPGTNFAIVGSAQPGTTFIIANRSADGLWVQLLTGAWIDATLVTELPAAASVAQTDPQKPLPPQQTQLAPAATVAVPPTAPTPIPTAIAAPSATPAVPLAPTCQEIKSTFANSTSAQWNTYSEHGVRGTWIRDWLGTVQNVEGWSVLVWGYPMTISLEPNCEIYFVIKDEQEALKYSAGEQIAITVKVANISEIWGEFVIYVDEATANIRRGPASGQPASVVQTAPSQPGLQPVQSTPATAPKANVPPLEVLSNRGYVDGDWFQIVGEVRNNTNRPMQFVKIVVTFYDGSNKVVGTDYTYTDLDVIPPGGKSPFETATDQWAGTAAFKVQVEGRAGTLPRQDLVILSHDHYIDGDWLNIRGEVQNTGTTSAEFVKLVITLYDASGNVVGMDYTYTTLNVIPAGGTSPFETGTDNWPNFDHYDIQVQGR